MRPPDTPARPRPLPDRGKRAAPEAGPVSEARPRKPYRPPRLVTYGRLTDLTRFGGSQTLDSGGDLGNLQ